MTYKPDIHHRRSIRLRDYDYSTVGAYFVTLCVQNRECLFGNIVDGGMVLVLHSSPVSWRLGELFCYPATFENALTSLLSRLIKNP